MIANCRVDNDIVCHQCGKKGHMQQACKSKHKASQIDPNELKSREVCHVEEEVESEPSSEHSPLSPQTSLTLHLPSR